MFLISSFIFSVTEYLLLNQVNLLIIFLITRPTCLLNLVSCLWVLLVLHSLFLGNSFASGILSYLFGLGLFSRHRLHMFTAMRICRAQHLLRELTHHFFILWSIYSVTRWHSGTHSLQAQNYSHSCYHPASSTADYTCWSVMYILGMQQVSGSRARPYSSPAHSE